ncbi:MAG TPA: hydrogenase expression/formation protein HypE [Gemmatimonadales bacterium]|jgi:hydrogenase expression/formation protein HypE|nr:hydrogenase expression/formation protein HypE [Gemmatimonadales bacterium]
MTAPSGTLRFGSARIEMAHGAGGKAGGRLVQQLIAPYLLPECGPLSDAATIAIGNCEVAMTTDAFVVRPITFAGGSIGELAINGTANDLAVSGARPVAIVVSLILEEGLLAETLAAELEAMARAAAAAGVRIVGGDTKVVERGHADSLYITTAGIGQYLPRAAVSPARVAPGDKVIVSGPIGDHGITVLLARGDLDLESDIRSDTRCVFPMVAALLETVGESVHWMRDPTRGGLATSLNELAIDTALAIHLDEEAVPVRAAVRGACELLGLDPLHIANEGQFVAIVASDDAERALQALRGVPGGEEATLIGEVRPEPAGAVVVSARYGGSRIVDMLSGDPLPRIC